ncbi:uncharacterized protein LOC122571322 [Bombus pyrosoma]|uniref:uncharacterized protein LOC122571322 n=1 Tax=Bombus pyrosoma TaxID=396416 RepID=UPI001CB9771C|nr:uncharacterized protein LOC122571322 [Bombus pyrosoma]
MEGTDKITSLHRKRGFQIGRFTTLSKRLDEYEQSSRRNKASLTAYHSLLDDTWKQYRELQDELEDLGERDDARVSEITNIYYDLVVRVHILMDDAPASSSSKSPSCDSPKVAEPTEIKLPEIQLPNFDGAIENWHSFYDAFSSTIDRSDRLTAVQKFHYLRSSLTGKAARSIQSLNVTEINYPIAIDILKEKFDCHRQICMRHWDLIFDYPKISKETPEAIDDLLETVKANLQALEKLGEPITSNVVLIQLLTSKLPSAIIRKWQRTLPDKKMPSYTHLVGFLKTRTNGDRTSPTTKTKKTSDKHNRQRQHAPRSITFATTHRPTACPSCKGQHKIWHCEVFKAKSVKSRLEIVKRASLCANCLGQGHTIAQCSAGSCRICRQRHHTYLHHHQRHGKSRPSSGRSSSDRSSSGRSSPSSPTPRSSHLSRRASTSSKSSTKSSTRSSSQSSTRSSSKSSSRSSNRSSPRSSPRTSPKHEPRPTRTHTTGSKSSSSPQRQERK